MVEVEQKMVKKTGTPLPDPSFKPTTSSYYSRCTRSTTHFQEYCLDRLEVEDPQAFEVLLAKPCARNNLALTTRLL